jgi:lipopolysaccharide transport system permease protein
VLLSGTHKPSLSWLVGIPVLLIIQASLTFGVVIMIATLNAFLRDLEQLVRVVLLLLFYVTPIVYSASMVPSNLKWLLLANPLSPVIISWRAILIENTFSPYIFVAIVHAFILLLVAVSLYKKAEWKVAEVV